MTCIYFWKPTETYGFLGNWFPVKIEKDGLIFQNSEAYFMWMKAKLFGDNHIANKIVKSDQNPAMMKKLGQLVKNFDQQVWDNKKEELMYEANLQKFGQNEDLLEKLLKTKDAILVEASPYDKVWGIGLTAADAKKGGQELWKGENLLGKCLMKVRHNLMNK